MQDGNPRGAPAQEVMPELKKLSLELILQIDAALALVGMYGEVRLIVQHGELRYVNRVESQRARAAANRRTRSDVPVAGALACIEQ